MASETIKVASRGPVVGLALFRVVVGAALAAMPWISGEGLDGYGATQLAGGLALVAIAPLMHARPSLRWVQALLAVSVLVCPFVFDDVRDVQIYVAMIFGKVMLISAIPSAEIFEQS